MDFYTRYAQTCVDNGIDPCSQKAADMFGVTRATISTWNKRNKAPKGETVAVIADALSVSADYLLGRTDDPTDHTKSDFDSAINKTDKPYIFQADTDKDKKNDGIMGLYNQLDAEDKIKIEGIIQGMLLNDKYRKKQQSLA